MKASVGKLGLFNQYSVSVPIFLTRIYSVQSPLLLHSLSPLH